MTITMRLAGGAAFLSLTGHAAAAQPQPASPPAVFNDLTACREVRDDSARLACFDRAVAALQRAQAAREVVVVDREEVQRTRRSLFGLAIPEVGRLFGESREEAIEGLVTSARTDQLGRTTFQLDTGAVWVQTEGRRLRRPPAPGVRVRIRRGALGGFLANVADQPAIRVIRQR